MTEIMTWNYAGEADITYGEVHVSPVAKILLAISLIFIVVSAVSAIVFRDNIYDIITNPRIVLLNQVRHSNGNYLEISYNSDFAPTTIIDPEMYKNEYTIVKIDSNVDSSKLGTYQVKYISKNSVKTNLTALTVYVKDKTAPEIKFKPNSNLLVRGAGNEHIPGTDSYKTPKEFIDGGINDDYDGEITDITNINVYDCSDGTEKPIPYEDPIDYGSGIIIKTLKYTATDKAGNMCTKTLTITIVDNYEEDLNELDRLKSSMTNNTSNANSNNNSSSGNKSNTTTSGQFTFSATPVTWSESQSEPLEIVLRRGITYNGNGTAYLVDGPGITSQLDGPGVYNYTWECSEGSTITQQVTITD